MQRGSVGCGINKLKEYANKRLLNIQNRHPPYENLIFLDPNLSLSLFS
jgi:hypothetical protein